MINESDINKYKIAFFENSEMLISIYDKDLNLLDANTSFLKTLKLEKQNILGKNINEISPDCISSGRYRIYEEVMRSGKPYITDQVQLHPRLGGIHLRLHAFKLGDGLGISSKEITDLKETISDLETLIYKISHDIRSPIATSLGLLNIAEHELHGNKTAMTYLGMIKQQTELLDKVVRRLVETTNIRQRERSHQLIDFHEKIERIFESLAENHDYSRININKNIELVTPFYSDKTLLFTILKNLIQNALKYKNESSKTAFITISISEEGNNVIIKIEDNGIGITEEDQKNVFRMFFRANNKSQGSGLGLYTVKHCVKKLEGQIELESVAGKGTTFTLSIPNSINYACLFL